MQSHICASSGCREAQPTPRLMTCTVVILQLRLIPGGLESSNQRAEVYAVVLALRRCAHKLEIRSDFAYVVEGMQHYMNTGSLRGQGDSGDLWSLLTHGLANRKQFYVSMVWVEGHATPSEVQSGHTTMQNMLGNDAADVLATSGAMLHSVPTEIPHVASMRRLWAKRHTEVIHCIACCACSG